ncbi:MAG: 3-phosphoshikimate 1-carboxyvinyltransferase [Planctomycetaceae bacterium]|nr:3-phosphoshikimate 1-carboxyvinyltransferase [Planctomycetaceae bacterium]
MIENKGDHSTIEIPVVEGPICALVTPPGSKSLTNRALICAALASGKTRLTGALDSEDTQIMIAAWRELGINIESFQDGTELVVHGCGGVIPGLDRPSHQLFMGNSGTSIRFLTATLAACGGDFVLDGVPRMRQRPIGDLGAALRQLGADVQCQDGNFPPVSICSQGLAGGHASVAADLSSQFLSGLLMAAPLAKSPVTLAVAGAMVSEPYVAMTCAVMQEFGVHVQSMGSEYKIEPQRYLSRDYWIEPDASAASYFWALAAITGGDVTVRGLHANSLQGDVGFVRCLQMMGCRVEYLPDAIRVIGGPLCGIEVDMNRISDTVQTLAAVALFASGPTVVRGVAHNRVKETDRIDDLATELRRLGASVETFSDGLAITPGPLRPAIVQTYNDHRMAMSLALVGLRQEGIHIANPSCTAKTYPNYFQDLFSACRHASLG